MVQKLRKLLFLPLALLMFGCAAPVKFEQPVRSGFLALDQHLSLGQTFVPYYDGLQAISLYLEPGVEGEGALRLEVRANPQESRSLRTTSLPLTEIALPGYYRFQFPPLEDSKGKDYFFLVSLQGTGSARISSANGDVYLNGSQYVSEELHQEPTPQDAQLCFTLEYQTAQFILGLVKEGLTWLVFLVAGLFLFIIPGWALLDLLWPDWRSYHWGEKTGLAGGLSLAIYPILMLWTNLIGLHLGSLYAWLPPLLGCLYLLARILPQARSLREDFNSRAIFQALRFRVFQAKRITWLDFALFTTIILIIATRFWAIRRLDLPLWGDSYQHSVIAQLIVDHDGLFRSWQPYAEMGTFTYHFGFHSLVAVFHWITHLSVPQAVLWTGQMVNCLAVIGLFPLVMHVRRNPWGGLATILFTGLLVSMPMFYLNWGRYTQLAGQAILPLVIFVAWTILESDSLDWRRIAISWLSLSGLALTHYRVLIFAILFYLAIFLFNLHYKSIGWHLRNTFWCGIGGALLFLPWFINTFSGQMVQIVSNQLTTMPVELTNPNQFNAIGNLSAFLPPFVWLSLPVLIAWGMWRRQRSLAIIILWWFLIYLVTNPQWLYLPGSETITNFAVFMAAYIPAGLILGETAGLIMEKLLTILQYTALQRWRWSTLFVALLAVVIGLLGARQRLKDVHIADHALATRPDLRAASWIQQRLPQESRFLVNSFFAYEGTSIVGSDGGWWLPLIAQRQTTLPPLNYVSEKGPRPDYLEWVNHLTAEINLKGVDHPDVLKLLEERGITHIYIGQRQGVVNSGGNAMKLQELLASPDYIPVYHQDRVWVFQLRPSSLAFCGSH